MTIRTLKNQRSDKDPNGLPSQRIFGLFSYVFMNGMCSVTIDVRPNGAEKGD